MQINILLYNAQTDTEGELQKVSDPHQTNARLSGNDAGL